MNNHFIAPTCSARCPLHRATVRRAVSMLTETLISPPTPPRCAQGRGVLLPSRAGEGWDWVALGHGGEDSGKDQRFGEQLPD